MASKPPSGSSGKRLLRYLMQHNINLPEDYLHKALQLLAQGLMDAEVSQQIAASRYERRDSRRAYRNGYRTSQWRTHFGRIAVRVPKLRSGTYTPSFLDHPQSDMCLAQLAAEAFLYEPALERVREATDKIGVRLNMAQAAALQGTLYDLVQHCQSAAANGGDLSFDQLRIAFYGRERDLALAIQEKRGKREIIAYEITREADHIFWQDFIRRLKPTVASTIQYINNSNVYHVLQLTETDEPQMALAA